MTDDRLVLDANVAIEWFFPGKAETQAYAFSVLDLIETEKPLLAVPSLFHT